MMSTIFITKIKTIYYFDINYLNIPRVSGLQISEIKRNYDYTINYIFDNSIDVFKPPTLSSSLDGSQHFKEVRNLFNLGIKLLIVAIPIGFILIYILWKNKIQFSFLKYSGLTLLSIPFGSLLLINVDFTKAFTIFHRIMFNNDKWLLDPVTDPIINMMPEEFFAHCGIAIILLSAFVGIVLYLIYRNINGKSIRSKWRLK